MLGDERFAVACGRCQRRQIVQSPDVAERDADIAQKTAPLDPLDRRATKHFPKLLIIQREKIMQPPLGIEVRNQMIFGLTGGGSPNTTAYRLAIAIGSSNLALIVDPSTGRADVQNYNLEASYQLIEVGTGKALLSSGTFARVTYNLPGQQQRFAANRMLRDAETRAAGVIAENIRNRLASYFTAGT